MYGYNLLITCIKNFYKTQVISSSFFLSFSFPPPSQSSTGSGKTLCFLVPLFARLCVRLPPPHALFALVIAPTRELAVQTHAVAAVFATEMHLQKPLLLIGGTSKDDGVALVANSWLFIKTDLFLLLPFFLSLILLV